MNDPSDPINLLIVERLRANGRESISTIAQQVNLSPAAVSKRIAALEASGAITGFTVRLDYDRLGGAVEAYVELTFDGRSDVHARLGELIVLDGVREAVIFGGEVDALLRVRVSNVAELRTLVATIRTSKDVSNTTTRVVLGKWWHGAAGKTQPSG